MFNLAGGCRDHHIPTRNIIVLKPIKDHPFYTGRGRLSMLLRHLSNPLNDGPEQNPGRFNQPIGRPPKTTIRTAKNPDPQIRVRVVANLLRDHRVELRGHVSNS